MSAYYPAFTPGTKTSHNPKKESVDIFLAALAHPLGPIWSNHTGNGKVPLTAKLFNLNFHPLEVVSRCRDPQLQVSENYSDLTNWRSTVFKYC